ncbi:creatininase family protein [Phytoactinopolyspora alkaliphila]|uniref:Creatininase family protein n=1 Tax=Phytoactinopolyspora alkaliphila TaxID=1783498 RepID=A0A6N9YS67_9ACTN|nr:creatininase family protein [Phytoactinopolyspora alkaliphila]NED97883.1 creatininase family protein [Phytoactinopolyspora alkaliphila]
MTTARLDHLTRDELARLAPRATVLVPLGSTEQHGPHLPVCADSAIVTDIAERAATQAALDVPVVVAPTLPFGFAHHHLPFGGTVSIGMLTYLQVLTDIGTSLHASGFRRLIFINGHGGNDAAVRAVGDRLVVENGLDMHVAGTSYWTCAADALRDMNLDVGPVPGHAGGFETSCLLALHPDRVRSDQFPPAEESVQPLVRLGAREAVIRQPGIWQLSDGRTDDSSRANADTGEKALENISDAVARFIVDFHRSSQVTA